MADQTENPIVETETMSTGRGIRLRSVCETAIRKCAETERVLKLAHASATIERQKELDSAEKKIVQLRRQAKSSLTAVQDLALNAEKVLDNLKLNPTAGTLPTSIPSSAGPVELEKLMRSCHRQAQATLKNLNALAEKLEEERRKWWKFW